MPGNQFVSRGNRRRDTVAPAEQELQPRDLKGQASGRNILKSPFTFTEVGIAPVGIERLTDQEASSLDPTRQNPSLNEDLIAVGQSRIANIQEEFLNQPDSAFLTPQARQDRETARLQAEADIELIKEQIDTANAQLEGVQRSADISNQFLESMGLPTTVAAAREDPEIRSGLNAITSALATGDSDKLDAAIDKLASVGEDTLDDLNQAFGRDAYLSNIQNSIRTQLHNLVENRQQVDDDLLAAEDFIALEAQAQADPLWDMEIDPTPSGMGSSTMINHMEVWLEDAFNGVMSPDQFATVAGKLIGIWQSLPSVEIDPETGEVPDIMTGLIETAIIELARGNPQDPNNPGLGFTIDKAQAMVEEMRTALKLGVEARDTADNWKTLDTLSNVSLAMAAGTVALENLEYDPEMSAQIANSWYLHRLIGVRSGGSTKRIEGKGNQYGLGNLPEHTYEWMSYTASMLEDNPELQMEALLQFIGRKFGAGYEGLQVAYSELVHNPDGWGDPPEGQG